MTPYTLCIDGRRTEADLIARDADRLAVLPFGTEDEAVAPAGDSRYGLAGAVWINACRVVGPDVAVWVELTGGTRDPFTLG